MARVSHKNAQDLTEGLYLVKTYREAKEQLIKLANSLNVVLEPGKCWSAIFSDGKYVITFNKNTKIQMFVWYLAHEIGHIISLGTCKASIAKKFIDSPAWSFWEKEEEFRAWAIAEFILDAILPVRYNSKYIKLKHKALKTYYVRD